MNQVRSNWGSSFGFILAAAGSAVGVGNLWKFPYITWDNQGGAFVLIYLACVALVGLPILCAELIIGRKTQLSTVPAMIRLGNQAFGGRNWKYVGWIGILGGAFILSYVVVIAGWALAYFFICLKWSFAGYAEPSVNSFTSFISNSSLQLMLSLVFSLATMYIVSKGIGGGIERANKLLMPALFIVLLLLLIHSMTMKGFTETLNFLFIPHLTQINTHAVLEAMGQAFFSLSLGMGIMITYGSYMGKAVSIPKAAGMVVTMDTLVAIIASMVMYTILFTFPEVQNQVSGSTTGMLFTTLPVMFYTKLPGGFILGPIFYLLVIFAALSSTISLLEVVTALLIDQFKTTRKKATLLSGGMVFMITMMVIFSLNPTLSISRFQVFGTSDSGLFYELNQLFFRGKTGFMNVLDHLVANWMLPITGLLTTLFAGWFINKDENRQELGFNKPGLTAKVAFWGFNFLARYIAPLAVLYILYNILSGQSDFT